MAGFHSMCLFSFLKKLLTCCPKSLSPLYDHQQCLKVSVPPWLRHIAPWPGSSLGSKRGPWWNSPYSFPVDISYIFLPDFQLLESHCVIHFVQFSSYFWKGNRSRPFYFTLITSVTLARLHSYDVNSMIYQVNQERCDH